MKQGALAGTALSLGLFAVLAVVIHSCAVNPVTGKRELSLVPVSTEEEIKLGEQAYMPAVQQQGGFYRDKPLEDYVQNVGTRLAGVSQRPNLPYRYRILNSSVPNAFALPGGFIVINRGLLVSLKNEAEMAAVLGHETGHVNARHSVQAYQRSILTNVLLAGLAIGTGGREAVMQISQITAGLLQNGFSRDQEREADSLGIDYMVKAHYSPEGAVQLQEYFTNVIEKGQNPLWLAGLFRTHPFSKDRLAAARAEIARKYPGTVGNPNYTLDETDFMRRTAHLREVQKAYEVADEGDKLLKAKQPAEALARYQQAIRMQPDQAALHASAGRAYLLLKNYPEAENTLKRAVQLDKELFEPVFLLGALDYERANYQAAIPALTRSMDLLPTKEAAAMLSKSYQAVGDQANAQKYADMAK